MSRPTMTKNQYVAGMRAAMMASGMAARRTHNGLLFTEDDWQQVNFKHSTFSRCDWYEEDADFSESTFHMAEFDDVEMAGGTFRYVNFDSALFTKCTMDRATIDGAVLRNTSFDECSLQGVHFRNCKISLVSFRDSDLREASFSDVQWLNSDLSGADLRDSKGLPDAKELVARGCKIAGACGLKRDGAERQGYAVTEDFDPSGMRPRMGAHTYHASSVMGAVAQHVRDHLTPDLLYPNGQPNQVDVDGESVNFMRLSGKVHLLVEKGDPSNRIGRLLGVDDPMPLEKAEIRVQGQSEVSVVVRGIDIEKHRGSKDPEKLPIEWQEWGPGNRPHGQPFVTPIIHTISGPVHHPRSASLSR